jgi:hypothetical protein
MVRPTPLFAQHLLPTEQKDTVDWNQAEYVVTVKREKQKRKIA